MARDTRFWTWDWSLAAHEILEILEFLVVSRHDQNSPGTTRKLLWFLEKVSTYQVPVRLLSHLLKKCRFFASFSPSSTCFNQTLLRITYDSCRPRPGGDT